MSQRYQYRRCEYQTEEWDELREDGYQTIAVSERHGMALMRRERISSSQMTEHVPEPRI